MGYPSDAMVSAAAASIPTDPAPVYSYCRVHARTPTKSDEQLWESSLSVLNQSATGSSFPIQLLESYIEATGNVPGGLGGSWLSWLQQQGYVNASGQLTGAMPQPGTYYASVAGPAAVATTGSAPPSIDPMGLFAQHPLLLAGGAAVVLVGLVALSKGRR